MFTVFDSKAKVFMQPFFSATKGQALRAFQDTVNDPKHQFYRYPEDFTLFHIGDYDDENCTFDIISPVALGKALEFKDVQKVS